MCVCVCVCVCVSKKKKNYKDSLIFKKKHQRLFQHNFAFYIVTIGK